MNAEVTELPHCIPLSSPMIFRQATKEPFSSQAFGNQMIKASQSGRLVMTYPKSVANSVFNRKGADLLLKAENQLHCPARTESRNSRFPSQTTDSQICQ
jgi:hypothetical protein